MNTIDLKKLEGILPTVSKPGRYLGNEWNVVRKDLDKADVKFALIFPDIYDVGMSYLGLRILYGVLNNRADVACERAFAPWTDFEERLRANEIPLFSLESKVPLKDFDIIGFSLTYEMNYANVLNILDLSHIPLTAVGRTDGVPLVIAGGPAAFNTAPMRDYVDAFVIGDAEEAILDIVDAYKKEKARGGPFRKDALLISMANIEGVYVPAFSQETKRRIVKDLDKAFYPVKEMVPNIQIIHDRITLEIMRGCPFCCKFCQASSFYRPVRFRSQDRIVQLAGDIYKNTGYEEISLLSLSTGSYPGITQLVERLTGEFKDKGVGISFSSLRSDEILKLLPSLIIKLKKTGLTFAPEAGSSRLRKYINKDIDDEKIVSACDEAFRLGWRLVKLYFMIGFPTETYADLEEIPVFINRILSLKKGIEVSVSINAFVPKIDTPFENEKMDPLSVILEKQEFLKSRMRDRRIKLKFHDPRLSVVESQFNKRDPRLGLIIHDAWEKGAKLDAWSEHFNFNIWEQVFAEYGITF